jgi:hypothetical protein
MEREEGSRVLRYDQGRRKLGREVEGKGLR